MTVFSDWVADKRRIVILAGRFIWRGRLVEERGPFAILEDASQVLDHNDKQVLEQIEVGPLRVNAAAIEAIYPEEGTWADESPKKPARRRVPEL